MFKITKSSKLKILVKNKTRMTLFLYLLDAWLDTKRKVEMMQDEHNLKTSISSQ